MDEVVIAGAGNMAWYDVYTEYLFAIGEECVENCRGRWYDDNTVNMSFTVCNPNNNDVELNSF